LFELSNLKLLSTQSTGTVQRRKVKVSKRKDKTGKTKIYDDDELDAESEYDSVGSADLDKMIARQICEWLCPPYMPRRRNAGTNLTFLDLAMP